MIGRLIDGRYQVRSRIARGGMATVYVATDLRLERRVALKIMHGHLADDAEFKERFVQEARSAARLAHPNVVNVFDQGQDSDMAYLVMEYLPGITLRDLLQEHKTLTTEQTFDILEAVLSGLAAAHKSGIVHRDLKPENVLLADDGRIKIGDFGLARAATNNTATGAALLGTIAYLSPELVTRGIADTRSDIYAVGIMMYEMLAGEQPFKGEQPMQIAYQHANDSVPTPSTKNPRVPAELDELVLWATAREPNERPRDARAMLEQLLETQNQMQSALSNSTSTQRTMVLPSAPVGNDNETQVLRPQQAMAVALADTGGVDGATHALAVISDKRKARGWWLLGLVLLLAALAGGTGWWFGWGPGSTAAVPESVVGMSPEAATSAITEAGLTVSDEIVEVNDPYVEVGAVASTDPAVGVAVPRDTIVTLQISKGPASIEIPAFAGKSEEDVTALLEEAGFIVDADARLERFNAKSAAGTVIGLRGVDEGGDLFTVKAGGEYFDKGTIVLVVSVGALPDVTGKTFDEAKTLLANVNLTGEQGGSAYNDTIEEGRVIEVQSKSGANSPISPGDEVLIVTSRGPNLVAVPDVTDKTLAEAVELIEAAGLKADVRSLVPEDDWDEDYAIAANTEPGAGEKVKKGSTVIVWGRV